MLHIHLIDCDSTQDALKEQLRNHSENECILVSCENQLKGRGRGDHVWQPMPGALYLSVNVTPHAVPSFTAIELSLLIARFIESKGKRLMLKWPNDLYTEDEKKCAGVLVQGSADVMLAGIGINLFSDSAAFGGVFESSFEVDKKSWCLELASYILSHRYPETETLRRDWEARCLHLNQEVTITEGETSTRGLFVGLGVHGEARLQTEAGTQRLYNGSLRWVTSR